MNNLVFIVFDSARFDHARAAKTRWLRKLGRIEKRYSYASWTSPSHFTYLMGQLPHLSPKKTFASKAYERDLRLWSNRLGLKNLDFNSFLPELSLPNVLRAHGYRNEAIVSMPVLNPKTILARYFDSYRLMPSHDDFAGIVDRVSFTGGRPKFYFINAGETHYPYCMTDSDLPRLHGLHGTLKHIGDGFSGKKTAARFFSKPDLKRMKNRQIECIEALDSQLERLFEKCPPNTHVIVTSDHGELFGEDGYFGHGPIFHEKVFEIPFVEGRVPH
ncbi:MAG TPA: sulfatase-like hydrolase/transferase [Bdellovibrionales bacterium]|nr:sulfatase-like hydrolase/transferase [Bdellovibrionales bacterium]